MAHVREHSESTVAFDVTNGLEDEAVIDREIAALARSMRPQLRIPKPFVWAGLVSLLSHSAVAIALTIAPHAPAPHAMEQPIQHARSISIDWDLYAGNDAGLAALDADENAPDDEPPAVDMPVVEQVRPAREREDRTPKATPSEEAIEATRAPVDALLDDGAQARIQVPTGEDTGAAQRQPEIAVPSEDTPTAAGTAGTGRGSRTDGANRAAGGIGDGSGVDIQGIRRGHIANLNRAIRQQNPCTRELSHRGLSGDVVLGLTQAADGQIQEVRVLRSSGESLIDRAAESFILAQRRLPSPDAHLVGEVYQVGLRFKCGN